LNAIEQIAAARISDRSWAKGSGLMTESSLKLPIIEACEGMGSGGREALTGERSHECGVVEVIKVIGVVGGFGIGIRRCYRRSRRQFRGGRRGGRGA
jgi:hypothetical protein